MVFCPRGGCWRRDDFLRAFVRCTTYSGSTKDMGALQLL